MQQSLALIDQLIEMAQEQDKLLKILAQYQHKSSQTLGEGSLLFHLKQLRALVSEEYEGNTKPQQEVTLGGKTYKVAFGHDKFPEQFLDGEKLPFSAP
jgi:hypothetical protein